MAIRLQQVLGILKKRPAWGHIGRYRLYIYKISSDYIDRNVIGLSLINRRLTRARVVLANVGTKI